MNDITSYRDGGTYIDDTEYVRLMQRIDQAVLRAGTSGDNLPLVHLVQDSIKDMTMSGLTLARATFEAWRLDPNKIDFDDRFGADVNRAKQTIKKYRLAWQYMLANPDLNVRGVQENLRAQPMGTLLLLRPVVQSGELQEAGRIPDLAKISSAEGARDLVKDIRGTTTGTDAVYITIDSEGELNAVQTDSDGVITREPIGFLNLHNDEPLAKKAIARIRNNSRILGD